MYPPQSCRPTPSPCFSRSDRVCIPVRNDVVLLKVTISEVNTDLPGLDRLLIQKQRLRNMWQETRDPACKTAVNWVKKAIRRMTRRRALERWETKIANADVTPQAIWPIQKSFMRRDVPK
jgi:hypothetical protein